MKGNKNQVIKKSQVEKFQEEYNVLTEIDTVKEKLDKILVLLGNNPNVQINKEIMTAIELSKYTGISLQQIYRLKSQYKIPYSKKRKKSKTLYIKKDIDNWIKDGMANI